LTDLQGVLHVLTGAYDLNVDEPDHECAQNREDHRERDNSAPPRAACRSRGLCCHDALSAGSVQRVSGLGSPSVIGGGRSGSTLLVVPSADCSFSAASAASSAFWFRSAL